MRHLALGVCVLFLLSAPLVAENTRIRLVDFETTVNPVSKYRIMRAIDEAEEAGDEFVLIRLDTPGGDVGSLQTIVKRMLAAEVPVVVWVGPAGAHAGSAGFFILIAADVATMAPGTRAGAASTIVMGGENREDDVLLKKMNEDGAALLRSIAERRGRNIEFAEQAVFEAKAYEESVALANGLIDFVALDMDELLSLLDGREVTRFDGTTTTLSTAGAEFVTTEFEFKHEFREFLANPTIAYLLLMGGLLGLYVEFTQPGVVFPGVVGALCLILFAIASTSLPVSVLGVLLILLAIVMFVLEVKVHSFGMLTVGGVISLIIGSLMLIDGPIPEMRVPFQVVLPVSLVIAAICVYVVALVVRAHQARVHAGVEGLADELGTVTRTLGPKGKVFVHGEIWNASAARGTIAEGARVRIVAVDSMHLTVEPADGPTSERS